MAGKSRFRFAMRTLGKTADMQGVNVLKQSSRAWEHRSYLVKNCYKKFMWEAQICDRTLLERDLMEGMKRREAKARWHLHHCCHGD